MRRSMLAVVATNDEDVAAELEQVLRAARLGVVRAASVGETMRRLADRQREPRILLMDAGLAHGGLLDALHAWVEVFGRSLPPTIFWAGDAAQEHVADHLSFLIDINAHRMDLPLDMTALAGLAYHYASETPTVPSWGTVLREGAHCPAWRPRPWMLRFR